MPVEGGSSKVGFPSGITLKLPFKVLKAKRAVKAAGFQSGKFRPSHGALRLEVLVPIVFEDWDFSVEDGPSIVRKKLLERAGFSSLEEVKVEPRRKINKKVGC